jgi:hypothetical protein
MIKWPRRRRSGCLLSGVVWADRAGSVLAGHQVAAFGRTGWPVWPGASRPVWPGASRPVWPGPHGRLGRGLTAGLAGASRPAWPGPHGRFGRGLTAGLAACCRVRLGRLGAASALRPGPSARSAGASRPGRVRVRPGRPRRTAPASATPRAPAVGATTGGHDPARRVRGCAQPPGPACRPRPRPVSRRERRWSW